jgi:mRNA interferase MazF
MSADWRKQPQSYRKKLSEKFGIILKILSMTIYNFGDVVLVPFPFTDQTSSKNRPAVVVSSAAYQSAYLDLIIMAITSQARAMVVGEVTVTRWKEAGLLKPSVIKPVLATIDRALILRKFGRLEPEDQKSLRDPLPTIFG